MNFPEIAAGIKSRCEALARGGRATVIRDTPPVGSDMATIAKMDFSAKPLTPQKPQAGTVAWLNECIERGKREVFTEVTTLTPGLAGELLRRNPDNRSIRATKAAQYAADIRAGKWTFNGEPIIVSDTGEVNDGQHRCGAVIDANKPIPVLMVFGVPRETRLTVDQGATRSAADYAHMDGVTNSSVRASVARILIAYERSGGTNLTAASYVTNAEVLARIQNDDALAATATFVATNAKASKPYAAPAVIGFCHYLFSEINPVEAEEYLGQVCRGEGLKAKDPAYTVRDRLLNLGTRSREKRIHIIIRGWNAYRQGRPLTIAKITGDENIPALI